MNLQQYQFAISQDGEFPETKQPPVLAVVVPCYNEEQVLCQTAEQLRLVLSGLELSKQVDARSTICFVDDGSRDSTWRLIEQLCAADTRFHGIRLSRNCGHQRALLAGLLNLPGDAIISIDADLQDDVLAMYEMVTAYRAGAEIVYGVRRKRDTDTLFKRAAARSYYRLLQLLGVEIVHNHADYRLLGRRALDALQEYSENNLFLRGLIPQLGFKSATVYYDRKQRLAGESKYPLGKMVGLAMDGITSFSAAPLRIITALGFILWVVSLGISSWALWVKFFGHKVVPGWTSIVLPMYLLGGIQLFCIGVVGQYLSKIYAEVKKRPRFTIDRII